jgi:hypothetical protein
MASVLHLGLLYLYSMHPPHYIPNQRHYNSCHTLPINLYQLMNVQNLLGLVRQILSKESTAIPRLIGPVFHFVISVP